MNKHITIIGAIVITAVVLTACKPKTTSTQTAPPNSEAANTQVATPPPATISDCPPPNPVTAQNSKRYLAYNETEALAAAQTGKVVLFFHAAWCPTCKSAHENIINNLNKIPENVTIFKLDYDTEKELKKKYEVTYQHTFVQIDANGEAIHMWSGGELDMILEQIE